MKIIRSSSVLKEKKATKMFSESGSIFMLHRIAPYEKDKIVYNEDMKISPEELRTVIQQLRNKKRVFLSLDELYEINIKGKESKYKFSAFTLDDGYKDNLEYGYPIFKEQQVPFCIYITNSFPNRTTNLWWYALEELVLNNDTLLLSGNTRVDNTGMDRKSRHFLELRERILSEKFNDPISYLREAGRLEFDLPREMYEKCLSWDEITSLSLDPLVTIGAHSVNHYPLSKLDNLAADSEIKNSKRELEQRTGKEVNHFAFPFGGRGEAGTREYDLVRSMGFKTAVTTLHGHVYAHDDLCELKRLFLRPIRNNPLAVDELMQKKLKDYVKNAVSFLKKIIPKEIAVSRAI